MTTILVSGTNGLLGQKIVYQLRNRSDVKLIATSKGVNRTYLKEGYIYEDMDITNPGLVKQIFEKYQPDVLINTAAMTNVDACENNQQQCRQMNIEAVANMIELCKTYQTHFIHLSTDFVFDGTAGPYTETDKPNPLSYYAQSKYESELLLQNSSISWCIIRTIIIYGVVDDMQRSNVVLWTINSCRNQKHINVITDQYRMPTLAEDLADACIEAAMKRKTGIFHVSGNELMSIWECVQRIAEYFKLDKSYLHPVTTAELNQPAKRPLITGFVIKKAEIELNYHPHSFEEGLAIVEKQLTEKQKEVSKN